MPTEESIWPTLAPWLALAVVLAFVFSVVFYRKYEALALASLARCWDGLPVHTEPAAGDVLIRFHAYHGLLAWFTQTELHFALPAEDAALLLGRLLRFNLKWGLWCYGGFFVPLLTTIEYLGQKRSIRRQIARF